MNSSPRMQLKGGDIYDVLSLLLLVLTQHSKCPRRNRNALGQATALAGGTTM